MRKTKLFLIYCVSVVLMIFIIFAFYWIGISSLKPEKELLSRVPTFIPVNITLMNYKRLFLDTDFFNCMKNSLYVSIGSVILTVVLSTLGAFSIYRCKFKERETFFIMMILTYVFPRILILNPLYQIMSTLGLVDRLESLMLINTVFSVPFGIWLLRAFFREIPIEVEEAALLDGATRFQTIYKIYVPLAAPGIVTVGIFAFISSWTEFQFSSIFIVSQSKRLLSVGLTDFISHYRIAWGESTAGAVMASIGPLIFFAFVGKYFIKGLTGGSIK